jgi:hypothetical protein
VPLKSTLYCAYGYLISTRGASHLLDATSKATWPVDYWRVWLASPSSDFAVRVGAVVPEVISTWDNQSSIQDADLVEAADQLPRRIKDFMADVKHTVHAYWN